MVLNGVRIIGKIGLYLDSFLMREYHRAWANVYPKVHLFSVRSIK